MSPDHPSARPGDSTDHPLDWAPRVGASAVTDVLREMDLRVARRRRRRRWQLATSIVALAIAAGIAGHAYFPYRPSESVAAAPATAPSASVARSERQVLPDGSVVDLKPAARITVAYSETFRRVVLEQGEAHFAVAKNPHRPFIVAAGEIEFRAVGTAFSVQRDHRAVEIVVTEGRVAVDQPASGTTGPTRQLPAMSHTLALVDAGKQLVIPAGTSGRITAPKLTSPTAPQITQRAAGRAPTVELSATPLGEALAVFNQHSAMRLVLGAPELAHVRLSGILRADNTDTLLALLADSHDVRVERRGNTIVLHRNP